MSLRRLLPPLVQKQDNISNTMANIKNGVCSKDSKGVRKHSMKTIENHKTGQKHDVCNNCGYFPV